MWGEKIVLFFLKKWLWNFGKIKYVTIRVELLERSLRIEENKGFWSLKEVKNMEIEIILILILFIVLAIKK